MEWFSDEDVAEEGDENCFPSGEGFSEAVHEDRDDLDLPALSNSGRGLGFSKWDGMNSSAQLDRAVAFIVEQPKRGIVYVHCKIGYSRSAAVVGAYLLDSGMCKTADEAIAHLKSVRPAIVIRPEVEGAIRGFDERRNASLTLHPEEQGIIRDGDQEVMEIGRSEKGVVVFDCKSEWFRF